MLDMLLENARSRLAAEGCLDGVLETGVGGLRITQVLHSRPFVGSLHQPLAGLALSGMKNVVTGSRRIGISEGDAFVVSHHVPSVSEIVSGTTTPYVSFVVPLDISLLHSIASEMGLSPVPDRTNAAVERFDADPAIVDAFARLLDLSGGTREAEIVGPLIVRELHFRFLAWPAGTVLRALLVQDSLASRVGRAIARIRVGEPRSIAVEELAGLAGMSTSSFHTHFKAVTGMTPLSYQKELRLVRAQELLRDRERSVSAVAFDVGFASPTQFSREYARRFGTPPRFQRERYSCSERHLPNRGPFDGARRPA